SHESENQRPGYGYFKVNVALLEKRGRVEDGQQPRTNQQAGKRHDQPQLSVPLFEMRELLANLRQDSFSLPMHCTTASGRFSSAGLSLAPYNVSPYSTKVTGTGRQTSGVGPRTSGVRRRSPRT